MAAGGIGTVRIVGTGLIGTSIGLALRGLGVRVLLSEPSAAALALAVRVGAGQADAGGEPVALVIVAGPPDITAEVVATELAAHPAATVTDVASVKSGIETALRRAGADLTRYVGGHPMAGRERSGPVASRADLFLGRPWVICPGETGSADPARVETVRRLALALGATPVVMPAAEHDDAVALISHVPQLAASLVAARLVKAADPAVGLAGQGLRDVTRIADSDPDLWAQILAANAAPVGRVLREIRSDLDGLIEALTELEQPSPGPAAAGTAGAAGAKVALARVVADGRAGRERIPGKHGEPVTRYATVTALLPDRPGQLSRLFTDIGEAGINVEEFGLEHAAGQQVGLAAVSVLPAARTALEQALVGRGWHIVS